MILELFGQSTLEPLKMVRVFDKHSTFFQEVSLKSGKIYSENRKKSCYYYIGTYLCKWIHENLNHDLGAFKNYVDRKGWLGSQSNVYAYNVNDLFLLTSFIYKG